MKKRILMSAFALGVLVSCNNDTKLLKELSEYNYDKESEGYHFGDVIELPKHIKDQIQNVAISLGEQQITDLKITEEYFKLGENAVSFVITTKNGEKLTQDATINVFAKQPEKELSYEIIATYPHNSNHFVQGFQLEGDTIYESVGQNGSSKIMKYKLGTTSPSVETPQPIEIFSEGAVVVGNKVYQLTWQNRKGFIYDKETLTLQNEFAYPNAMMEGWGLTFDGTNLVASDGTKNIYFLDIQNPSKLVRHISVAGNTQSYGELNELEYHNGFLYANIWKNPTILKINPKTGEVVAKIDLTQIALKHTTNAENVLNGIAFKGDNMLVTGKNWDTIYEISIK